MSRKHFEVRQFHLLPEEASREDTHAGRFNCGVGGHSHLLFSEVYGNVPRAEAMAGIRKYGAAYRGSGMLEREEVEWLCFPNVLRLVRRPEKRKCQRIQFNDLSARVGPFLAEAVRRTKEHEWPHVLLAAIRPATAGRR
jgi:hypothetical protein